jgi:hypothetical protein
MDDLVLAGSSHAADMLPDSRSRSHRGGVKVNGVEYEPIYCVNCGKQYGLVPAALITHVTALCDTGCAGKYGDLAHFYVDADAKFRANAIEAVAELVKKLGRPVTADELDRIAKEDATSSLAAVYRDWQARLTATR